MSKELITKWDKWQGRLLRQVELLRGWWLCRQGAEAGEKFGLGMNLTILYPACLMVGDHITIEGPGYMHCLSERGVRIGDYTSIARNVWLHCGGVEGNYGHGFFSIGQYSFVGPNAVIGAGGGVAIGNNVLFGPNVIISSENHHFDDRNKLIREQGVYNQGVIIEDDSWIASNVIILDGVTIGQGAVIAAGSVVTKDVAPFSVVAGIPARFVRMRGFSTKTNN